MQKTLSVINLLAIRRNALKIKEIIGGAEFFAVVKADAYGHGAEEVSREIEDIVSGFCVAIIEEGISLRVAGIKKPILVFTPPLDVYDVARAKTYDLTVTVNSLEILTLSKDLNFHLKVNTGMNRFGCNLEEIDEILERADKSKIQGVYSHLYAPQDKIASERQFELFKEAERKVKKINGNVVAHLAASGGTLRGGKYILDGVRCGILLYGYAPQGFSRDVFEGAMTVYARRAQLTKFIGGGVGYNFANKDYSQLSTYRCGYAEGFKRTVPLGEGNLCMDAFVSERQDGLLKVFDDAEYYAKSCGTIPYEVLTSVTKRSERVYER